MGYNKLWKILKELGIQDHLTCLLQNLYPDQEATVRVRHGTTNWFKIGKGVRQGWLYINTLLTTRVTLSFNMPWIDIAYIHCSAQICR